MFKSNSIRKRVLAAVEAKIEKVEELYQSDLQDLERQYEINKDRLLDDHVNSILKSII